MLKIKERMRESVLSYVTSETLKGNWTKGTGLAILFLGVRDYCSKSKIKDKLSPEFGFDEDIKTGQMLCLEAICLALSYQEDKNAEMILTKF